MQTNLVGTCWYDVEAAWLLLLPQGVLGPAQDGPVVQLVEWAEVGRAVIFHIRIM
jgi:hypothetical protein